MPAQKTIQTVWYEQQLAEKVWSTKPQSPLLNIYFRLDGSQSPLLLIHFHNGQVTVQATQECATESIQYVTL